MEKQMLRIPINQREKMLVKKEPDNGLSRGSGSDSFGSLKFRQWMSVLFILITIGFIFYICSFKLMDRDFWWHVKAGEIMLQTNSMIDTEPFAYTRQGQPYLARHGWLSQIVLCLVYNLAGPNGAIFFRTIMVIIAFLLLLFIDKKNLWLNSLLVIWAANVARPGYMVRPQLFTYVLFAGFLLLAFRYLGVKRQYSETADCQRKRILWSFVALQILWVNFHGGACIMGFVIVGALFCQEIFDFYRCPTLRHQSTEARYVKYIVVTGLGLMLASVISPNTYHNLTYLLNLLSDKTIAFIGEWQPREVTTYIKELGPFWLLAILSLAISKGRKIFSALVLLITGYMSMKAFRHEMLFVFSATGIIIFHLKHSPLYQNFIGRFLRKRLVALSTACGLLILLGFYTQTKYISFTHRVSHLAGYGVYDLARGAYDFLEQEGIQGHMFNTYGIGGYLLYRGYPHRKVYIDGRNVDYGFEFMNKTFFAGKDPNLWKELEDQFQFSYAVVDYGVIREKDHIPYCVHLGKNPNWKLVYIDDWVALYLNDIVHNKPVINKYAYYLVTPEHLEYRSLQGKLMSEQPPFLEQELQRIVASSSESIKAQLMLAKLYLRSQRSNEAREIVQSAIKEKPYWPEGYEILAAIHVVEENWKEAGLYYEKAINMGGNAYPDINYEHVANVFGKAGNISKAQYYMRKSLRTRGKGRQGQSQVLPVASIQQPIQAEAIGRALDFPKEDQQTREVQKKLLQQLQVGLAEDINNHIVCGVSYAEQGLTEKAKKEFLNALRIDPGYPVALNNLGAVYHQEGNLEQAIIYYQRALERNPDYADAHYNLALANYRLGKYKQAWQHTQQADSLGRDTRWLKKRLSMKMDNYPSRSRRSQE